jgi:hypothetical protein
VRDTQQSGVVARTLVREQVRDPRVADLRRDQIVPDGVVKPSVGGDIGPAAQQIDERGVRSRRLIGLGPSFQPGDRRHNSLLPGESASFEAIAQLGYKTALAKTRLGNE